MRTLAIQNVRGGCGSTSIAAGLAWALHRLGVPIVLVDCSPSNDLRLFFDIALDEKNGWARAVLDGTDWHAAAWRVDDGLDILPFGRLNQNELTRLPPWANFDLIHSILGQQAPGVAIFDLGGENDGLEPSLFTTRLLVARADMASYLTISEQAEQQDMVLLNHVQVESQLQKTCRGLFTANLASMVPVVLHYDEAMAESIAMKQPVGAGAPNSLAADELRRLAVWLLSRQA
ncbi:MAG: cellulose biosynthesis protein BcsQ [Acetobacter peroxydans]|nr:cellulose biosynthesis protein BcsQ [Acetobacter peroxydans]